MKQLGVSRRRVLKTAATAVLAPVLTAAHAEAAEVVSPRDNVLWYEAPAETWIQSLPLGGGSLGAMVFGGTAEERIWLNEDTLWSGGPYQPAPTVDPSTLAEVRPLIFAGEQKAAQDLEEKTMMAKPITQASYQTVGELRISFPGHDRTTEYRRELDLDTAIASTTYTANGIRYQREVLTSAVDRVIAIHLAADKPGSISFSATFASPQQTKVERAAADALKIAGTNGDIKDSKGVVIVPGALRFEGRVQAVNRGGSISTAGDKLTVIGANEVTLFIAAATNYKKYDDVTGDPTALCESCLARVKAKPFASIRRDHIAEYQPLFRRVTFGLGPASTRPTNQRIKDFATGGDLAFAALYFQYGRYLLISCSRAGAQPANLQGMWNDQLSAPWGGKYTININTEMNYWPAYAGAISEVDEPLIRMVEDIAQTGVHTAKVMYGAGGWVCHHNIDLWRATAPIDAAFYGMWPMGGAWLCNQIYERYRFDGDQKYFARIYPLIKGSAQFFIDTLVEEPKHKWLVTCPSMSPEHEWSKGVTACAGPTMDLQILRELFDNCINASRILKVDADFSRQCATTRERLAPMQVGSSGQLQEWLDDWDAQAPEVAHRHMSPLYGLYPGNSITASDGKFFAAARKLMEMRDTKSQGGWACAWRVSLWARLYDSTNAYKWLKTLIGDKTELNMFDKPSVQLDGNFGGTAGMIEMLLQSQNGEVHLLPALPSVWPDGNIRGLRARGGFQVDIQWKNGALERATLYPARAGTCKVRYGDKMATRQVATGKSITLTPENFSRA